MLARRYLSTGVFAQDAGRNDPGPCTVDEFPSAVARLVAYPQPHYVFFRADDDPGTGERFPCLSDYTGICALLNIGFDGGPLFFTQFQLGGHKP